ncbi:MAG: GNAT family N-acetyltransferase [Actinomycetota bacterium]|uniref:GNAT family N-acetyltransferase n=1 Tax=Lapillicoccus sp. TaxID=1909287 RepID=UPI0027C70DF9|nr:GNAT family N-acetyltransferase [Actinomycetota bacterium]
MSEISVRLLRVEDWRDYREVRLAALQESPQAFQATYAEEATKLEPHWRDCMGQADRLLAEREGTPLGVASVMMNDAATQSADLCDLWVKPEVRNTGIASRLAQAAADQAVQDGCTHLFYWVSTENGRAIAFASNAGFRVTSQRRTTRTEDREFGDQEIAMVQSLADDPRSVPSSSPPRLTSEAGPR